MSSRDAILAAVRAHLPAPGGKPPAPFYFNNPQTDDLVAAFCENLERMGGILLQAPAGDCLAPLRERLAAAPVTCSMVPEVAGTRSITAATLPKDLADIDIAVVRAAFGVAETGSVCFTERELVVNGLGYLPQHLAVLLDEQDIVRNIHDAYRRVELHTANYAVFHTGPSATADIEGVLIHGAQGVRSLSVLLCPRSGLSSQA